MSIAVLEPVTKSVNDIINEFHAHPGEKTMQQIADYIAALVKRRMTLDDQIANDQDNIRREQSKLKELQTERRWCQDNLLHMLGIETTDEKQKMVRECQTPRDNVR